jgi:hypothetical protein
MAEACLELSTSGDTANQKVGKLPGSVPLYDLRALGHPDFVRRTGAEAVSWIDKLEEQGKKSVKEKPKHGSFYTRRTAL